MHSDPARQLRQETNTVPFAVGDNVCTLSSKLAAEHERIGFLCRTPVWRTVDAGLRIFEMVNV